MKLLRMLTLLAALLMSLPAFAVELTGQIRGLVQDADKSPVPGTVVNLTSPQMQGGRTEEANADGQFVFIGLPPGYYTLEAIKPGFNKWVVETRVGAGETISLKVELKLAGEGDVMVITADKPVIDVTRTETGTTLSKEMLADIPNAGRDYQSAVSLSAGVVGSGNANMHGGYYTGNQFYLDGVNTTDPLTGTFSMNMNFDAIEEIQVITGGMDPEYGRSMGGAVNVTTQSGGNEFEGSVQLLYSGTNTYLYKPLPGEEVGDQEELNESLQTYLGGPIIQDKLWFSTSVQLDNYITTQSVSADVGRPANDPMQPRMWRSAYLYGKLTWAPNDAHRVWLHAQTDPTNIQNSEGSVYTLTSAETWWRQGGWLVSAGHTWIPDNTLKLETQVYTSDSYIKYVPMTWHDCKEWGTAGEQRSTEVCLDDGWDGPSWSANDPDGFSYGPQSYSYFTDRTRTSLNSSVMKLFSLLGEHQAKLGIQAEVMTSYSIQPGLENGIEYWSWYGDSPSDLESYAPALLLQYSSNQESLNTGQLVSWYLQDVWHPVPRLTIRGGVRFDWSNLNDDTGVSVFRALTAAPRIGVAYDLTGDGKTALRGYWGRFYDSGYLGVSDLLAKQTGGYAYYYWDDRAEDWSDTAAFSSSPVFEKHDDLINPYSDKFNLGLSRNLGGGWGMETTFVYEASHNYWEDDETNLIWNDEGTDVVGYRNGEATDIYRLRTPDEVFSQYTSIELAMNRQFDDHWGVLASYTFAHTYGLDKGNDTGLATGSLDNPEQYDEEVGLLSYDRPHAMKIAGSYQAPDAFVAKENLAMGVVTGWDFRFYAGEPLRRVSYNDYYGGYYNFYGGDDNGEFRYPAYSNLDLKLGLTTDVRAVHLELTAECFNVLNERAVVGYDTTYTDENGDIATDENGDTLWLKPLYFDEPRYFQFGLRAEF